MNQTILKRYAFLFCILSFLLFCLLISNIYAFYRITQLEAQYQEIKTTVESSNEANQKVLYMLQEIRDEQKEQKQIMQSTSYQNKVTVKQLKSHGFSEYNDLQAYSNITVEQMDKIIDYYDSHIKGGTPFKGKGYVFVQASKKTGLNPLYLFAHAAVESGFGKSYYAQTRGNYYGINAVDTNPDNASHMGNGVDEGIMAGAEWIKDNFYENGYTSLKSMKDGTYATDPDWEDSILQIMNKSIQVL